VPRKPAIAVVFRQLVRNGKTGRRERESMGIIRLVGELRERIC